MLALLLLGPAASQAQSDPVLNELVFNHTGTDTNEYVEVFGDPGADYSAFTILEVEGDGSGAGTVDEVSTVGTTDAAGFWWTGFASNAFENGTVTLLLVEGFTGSPGMDLDTDNDGVLDAVPWIRVADGVAVFDGGTADLTYATAVLSSGFDGMSFAPGGASRIPDGVDTDTVADWLRNDFDGAGLPGFTGTPEPGEARNTPGTSNRLAVESLDPVLNELVANHTGTDTNEYVEVFGDPGVDYSAFTVLEIEGDSTGAGVVDAVFPVGTTDAAGFWWTGLLSNALENGTLTLLLVEGFAGSLGMDLDLDNDGVLDAVPWIRVADGVAILDGGSTDLTYATVVLSPGFDGGSFAPGGASRIPNGVDTDSVADWVRNDFDGAGLPGFSGTPEAGEALNTPGAVNELAPIAPPDWVINEVHADPASGSSGDANGDGQRDFSDDEFVEIVNLTGEDRDVSGWSLSDGFSVRHVFPAGTVVPAGCAVVVFGDGPFRGFFGGALLQGASSGSLGLNNGGDSVSLADAGLSLVTSVSYGGEGGNDQSLTRDPDLEGDFVPHTVAAPGVLYSPGTRLDGTPFDGCFAGPVEPVEIYEIQGSGLAGPFANLLVTTNDNVVTAVDSNGFFIQTPEARSDGDVETSDGIFVFTGGAPGVAVGDRVDLSGVAQEFFEMTEIADLRSLGVDSSGNPLPAPVLLDETTPSPSQPQSATELERFEGMLVELDGVATGPSDQFGDVKVVAKDTRAFREPGIEFPGLPGLPVWDGNPEIFEIDPDALGLADEPVFAGQPFSARGPLAFAFGDYQVWPLSLELGPQPAAPRPVRAREPAELTVGTQNLRRLFDDVDDPGTNEPVVDSAEYQLRLGKLSRLVRESLNAPDVLAVQEAESEKVLQDLADRIQTDDASVGYTPYLLEGNDVGGIDVGFLVRGTIEVAEVTQFGKDDVFDFDGSLLNDRPPLVLEGAYMANGAPFPITVINVHQRSLIGIDGSSADRVRAKRFEQALRLSQFIQSLQEGAPGIRLVVTGDFNAFEFTDGYVDVMGQVTGSLDPAGALLPGTDEVEPDLFNEVSGLPEEERYSFVFDGSAQVLDHTLTSLSLDRFVRGAQYARGNADAPLSFEADPSSSFAASDHDGLVLFVMSDEDADGVPDDADLCSGTEIPEAVPTRSLGTNRYALVDGDPVFDTERPPGHGPAAMFTIDDTAGCSCEQIIDRLELGHGHVQFGCSLGAMEDWLDLLEP